MIKGTTNIESKLFEPICQTIRDHLQSQKSQVDEEILYYPPPIPACDAQFNYLLEERARLSQLLWQLDTFAPEESSQQEAGRWLQEFLAASPDLDAAIIQEVREIILITA